VPKGLAMSVVVKVLQNLLTERVPIRNLRVIAETLAENSPRTQDPAQLVAAVRIALGRSIVQAITGLRQELPVITLDGQLEQVLGDSMLGGGDGPGFEPGLADRMCSALADSARRQELAGEPAVLLTTTEATAVAGAAAQAQRADSERTCLQRSAGKPAYPGRCPRSALARARPAGDRRTDEDQTIRGREHARGTRERSRGAGRRCGH